jgi:hypothetical protein
MLSSLFVLWGDFSFEYISMLIVSLYTNFQLKQVDLKNKIKFLAVPEVTANLTSCLVEKHKGFVNAEVQPLL